MKAIFLAAGEGSRLRPLTDELPKCMIPFRGKPLLQYGIVRSIKAVWINKHPVKNIFQTKPFKYQSFSPQGF